MAAMCFCFSDGSLRLFPPLPVEATVEASRCGRSVGRYGAALAIRQETLYMLGHPGDESLPRDGGDGGGGILRTMPGNNSRPEEKEEKDHGRPRLPRLHSEHIPVQGRERPGRQS
ncbi:uncharacterized protein LY79DRAFT_575120 [Colletotrichum navitas]|uniref:Uncharacterized protein n=1 Tax=Colletotrichum navitas TaxID=681940 RepID=A0AAD8QCE2_9PEZI|nr:uncharacterized protein LY79DRAFT_575120 [Colletotrichum navitas]KAK1599411.1 hypothetical protein LY79DRAFT_575120 [Colletotrichum navitas]